MKQETIYYIYAGKAIFVWNTRLYDFTSINNKTLVMYDNIVSLHRFWLRINLNIFNLGFFLFGSFFFKGGEAVILLWKYFRIPPDVQSTQILIFFFHITIYIWKNGKADLDMNCLLRNSRNISLSYLFITISHSFGARSGREKLIFLKTGSNSRILQTTDTALGIMKTYFISYWSEPSFGLEPRSDRIYY